MRFKLTILVCVMLTSARLAAQDKSIKDLDILIGTWDVEEKQVDGSFTEKGVRTCAYVMHDSYIQCETIATSGGKERSYRFLINYNKQTKQFEMISIFSNWPAKESDILSVNGNEITLASMSTEASDRSALIKFNGKNSYEWSGRNFPRSTPEKVFRYVETGVRK